MYTITVEGNFSSAHNLRAYKGKCEELHGHNWRVTVSAAGGLLDKTGMVLDFHLLKNALKGVLENLDHTHLNKHAYFRKVNPTSEQIARYIYERMKKKVPVLSSVTVWENQGSSATYEE